MADELERIAALLPSDPLWSMVDRESGRSMASEADRLATLIAAQGFQLAAKRALRDFEHIRGYLTALPDTSRQKRARRDLAAVVLRFCRDSGLATPSWVMEEGRG